MTLHDTFSANVQARCKKLGWTQAELGRQLGLSRYRVHDVLRGRRMPGINTIEAFAEALGVDAWRLLKP